MNRDEKKSGSWRAIIGGIVLIIVLFIGVEFVFWALEQAIPQTGLKDQPAVSAGQSTQEESREDAPSFCVHCGKELPESFQWGQFCPWCGEKVE